MKKDEIESIEIPLEKKQIEVVIKSKDLGDGEVEVVVSSASLDRHGEIIDIDGIDTKRYMKNPVVQWAHDYDKPPIGKAVKLWKDGKKLMARMKFAIAENPFAKTIYELVKGGFLNAVSIGFIPLEMEENTFTKSEMIEFSVVPVPANPEALITAKKLGIDTSFLNAYNLPMNKKVVKKDEEVEETPTAPVAETEVEETPEAEEAPETPEAPEAEESKDDEAVASLSKSVKKLTKEIEELKASDPIVRKNIMIREKKSEEVSKEVKFLNYLQGVKSGNFTKYFEVSGKDAMNTTDDGVVLPPQEFVTEITRLEEELGVARRFSTVRSSSSGAGIKFLLGDDDVEIFDTAESGAKKSTALSYDSQTLLWRKFAAILPITDELTEDAAINLWADATARFARAFARREDELIFTETAAGGNTKDGIVNVAGTNPVTIADINALDYDDLVDMLLGIPSMSGNTGQFFLNRTMLAIVMKLKDDENRPLWLPSISTGAPATILGRPYTETEVLPSIDDAEAGDGIMVYGDLRYATLGERTSLNVKLFDSGIVGDPDEVDQEANTVNLLTQDAQAMRVVKRMNGIVRFPAAFSVLKLQAGS
jgi:HK97 family phage major capsid protein/HK97 family phage prohead protease